MGKRGPKAGKAKPIDAVIIRHRQAGLSQLEAGKMAGRECATDDDTRRTIRRIERKLEAVYSQGSRIGARAYERGINAKILTALRNSKEGGLVPTDDYLTVTQFGLVTKDEFFAATDHSLKEAVEAMRKSMATKEDPESQP